MQITTEEFDILIQKMAEAYDEGYDEGERKGYSQAEGVYKPYIEKCKELEKEVDYLKIKLLEFEEYQLQKSETINKLMRENEKT